MTQVLVPVRFPLTANSKRTLRSAIELAEERDADLTVLHVNTSDLDRRVTRTMLQTAIERAVDDMPPARYVVRRGALAEQTILEEVTDGGVDVVVLGQSRTGIVSRILRQVFDEPDVEAYLRDRHDGEIHVVSQS